jgi:hypothetical protein
LSHRANPFCSTHWLTVLRSPRTTEFHPPEILLIVAVILLPLRTVGRLFAGIALRVSRLRQCGADQYGILWLPTSATPVFLWQSSPEPRRPFAGGAC